MTEVLSDPAIAIPILIGCVVLVVLMTMIVVLSVVVRKRGRTQHDLEREKSELVETLDRTQQTVISLETEQKLMDLQIVQKDEALANVQRACDLSVKEGREMSDQLDQTNLVLNEMTTKFEYLTAQNTTLIDEGERYKLDATTLKEQLESQRVVIEQKEKTIEIAQLKLSNEQSKLAELKADFDRQKSLLKDEFKALSEGILKGRQHELQESNKQGLLAVVSPLKEEFGKFKKRVDEVHSEQTKGQGQLENELKNLKQMNNQLSERAENLTNALRNDKKQLGNWGELQLERLLENAGLDQNCYRREVNFKTEEGANQRPDFIIDLPEQKMLIIDSKVSLNAYVDGVNAQNEDEALKFLKQHTTNVRNHIKQLSEKSYDSLALVHSPDFVFLFMPNESAYLAAFEEDPSLFDFAYDRRIAVVTPNTLLPILRTVSSLWRIDQQNRSTEILAESASKVYAKLVTFLEKFERVGSQLDTLSNTFQDAKKTLTTGKGNLIKLAEGFSEKGVKISKQLPESLRE